MKRSETIKAMARLAIDHDMRISEIVEMAKNYASEADAGYWEVWKALNAEITRAEFDEEMFS